MKIKKVLLLLLAIILLFSLWACEKGEDKAISKSPLQKGPIMDAEQSASDYIEEDPETKVKIVIPSSVRWKWVSVILIVDDKKENKQEEFTVDIGGELKIPDSDLTVKVGPFLPDFKMTEDTITTNSLEPNNPSVGVSVMEKGTHIFPLKGKWGWLHAKFPKIHSFEHERYALALKAAHFQEMVPHEEAAPSEDQQ
jgi:hypothetical protein